MKKSRIIYICLFGMALFFVYFNGGFFPWTLFYASIILPLVSFVYTLYVYFRFKYIEEREGRYFVKGDVLHYKFSIHNEDVLIYPYINVKFHASEVLYNKHLEEKLFSVTPFSAKVFEFSIECKYRGVYKLGISSIEIIDFLNIFCFRFRPKETKRIVVYPRIVPIEYLLTDETFQSDIKTSTINKCLGKSSFYNLREYVIGDSLKNVHWKLSSKYHNWIVKTYDSHMEDNIILFLDLKKATNSIEESIVIEDKLIEAITSVSNYFLQNWFPVTLFYYDERFVKVEGSNPADFNSFYNIFAKIQFNSGMSSDKIMQAFLEGYSLKSTIFIFTAQLDSELFDKMLAEKASGNMVNLFYVRKNDSVSEAIIDSVIDKSVKAGINVHVVEGVA